MSLQDLFRKQNSNSTVVSADNASSSAEYVESVDTIRARQKLNDQFVPRIDFSTSSNFAKFGSSELYYDFAFQRIYNEYPYDGTEKEKLEFRLSSSYLDDYIFENEYPRTNGHVIFSFQDKSVSGIESGYGQPDTPEYILTKGGPHTGSSPFASQSIFVAFTGSNFYDAANDLVSSLDLSLSTGVTVEFWLKKEAFSVADTEKEVIFDVWNQQVSSSVDYGRLTIALTASGVAEEGGNPFLVTVQSGTTGFSEYQVPITNFTTASIADSNWHHYAFTFSSQSAGVQTKIYVDGVKKVTDLNGSVGINDIETITGNISILGGLTTGPSGSNISSFITGSGKLSGSMDEFRFWKESRSDKDIANNFFIPIGGGTNDFDFNRSLGLYYKFNEGITTQDATDSIVLDYSGRIANGSWTGYTNGARQTTSAMVQSGYARTEFKDPIIYSFHPTVVSSLATLKSTGSQQDIDGTSKMMALLPGWLQERDRDEYNNQVKKFTQIMASYFDNLNAQIGEFNNIFDEEYPESTEEPYPFAQKLLQSRGFVVPDLFVDGDLINYLLQKDNNEVYEMNITDVKNRIYHNIYNNLTYILKSKGTEKSFRNLLRCFGIDSEVMRLSLYADDSTYTILENYEYTSVEKKALNLNNRDNVGAIIYNATSSNPSFTYISSSEGDTEQYLALTTECEAVFPLQLEPFDQGYFPKNFLTASIFGFHRALTSSIEDYTWHTIEDTDLAVYAIRPELESKDVYFVATSSYGAFNLTSSTYFNAYDNNKWNFAFRIRNNKYPYTFGLTGSTGDIYYAEFVGFNSEGNTVKNSFSISASVSNAIGKKFLDSSKRLYAGANRTNFTGSLINESDVLITDVKFWQSYIDDETIKFHSYNPDNIGTKTPFRPDNINNGIEKLELTDYETLALHWRFDTLSSSNASGEITGIDFSSGSTTNAARNSFLGGITGNKYPFQGQYFPASSTKAFDRQFIYSAKQRNFGVLMSSDGITIKDDNNTLLFTDDDVSDNFYAFEKSYSGVISEEMLNMFASLIEFNDLIGYPIDGYKRSYKEMQKLARLFFEKMENRVQPEKFFEFYKWIDTSIMYALGQLFPASAKFSETSRNVIESHVLERNKLDRKFPILIDVSATEGYAHGLNELLYKWRYGHAPVGGNENENCVWQKHRKERTDIPDRQTLLDNLNTGNNSKHLAKITTDGTVYAGSTFAIRNFSKLHSFDVEKHDPIHGGINFEQNKNRDIVFDATYIHGPTTYEFPKGIPQNVLVVGVGEGQGADAFIDCIDELDQNKKRKWRATAKVGRKSVVEVSSSSERDGEEYRGILKTAIAWPHNLISGTVDTGYNSLVVNKFKQGVILSNVHSDTYAPGNEIGMQGPFTETWVGGHQSRHVNLNKHNVRITTNSASATATIVIDTNPTDGDTITIGDGVTTPITYTFKNTVADPSTQILIDGGGNPSGTMLSLTTKIEADFNISIPSGLATTKVLTNNNVGTVGNHTLAASFTSGDNSVTGFTGGVDVVFQTLNNIDDQYSREEGWRLLLNECSDQPTAGSGSLSGSGDGAMGFVGPDYGGPYPDNTRKYAIRYREERAKRPLNVKNIRTSTGSARAGNFLKNYEVVMIAGKEGNNLAFRDLDLENRPIDAILPDPIWNQVPFATHYQSLVTFKAGEYGNVWGDAKSIRSDYAYSGETIFEENNRQVEKNPGRTSNLSFEVSGTFLAGAKASGSFFVYSPQNVMMEETSESSGKRMIFGGNNYVIDSINPFSSDSAPNFFVQTGSDKPTDYYTNLRSKINSNGAHAATFTVREPQHQCFEFTTTALQARNISTKFNNTGSSDFDNLEESFEFWIDLQGMTFTGSNVNPKWYLFQIDSGSGNSSKELYFSGNNGELHWNVGYNDGGTLKYRKYTISGFKTYKNSGFIQLVINNTYPASTAADSTQSTIFVNGVSQSVDYAATAVIADVRNMRIKSDGRVTLFNSSSTDSLNRHSPFDGKCSYFAFYKDTLNNATIKRRYNNKYLGSFTDNNSIDPLELGNEYFMARNSLSAGGVLEFPGQLQNAATLTGSFNGAFPQFRAEIYTSEGVSSTVVASGAFHLPYGEFFVTASSQGISSNASVSFSQGSVFTYFKLMNDITGGLDPQGAFEGDQLRIDLDGGTSLTLEVTVTGNAHGSNIKVGATGSNTLFWNSISGALYNNTDFKEVTVTSKTDPAGFPYALFESTASIRSGGNNGILDFITAGGGNPRISFFKLSGPSGGLNPIDYYNIIERVRDDLTSSDSIVTTRFSSPGGPEIQSRGFLDVRNQELSVYNAMPFRNLTVRASSSGESGRIRLEDHLLRRDGLRTHLSRHSGKFGHDSEFGSITANNYVTVPSFHKIQRNDIKRMNFSGDNVVTGTIYNNGFFQSCIPQSDFQYSWVTGSIGEDIGQRILGFAPPTGFVSSSDTGVVDALIFPTGSYQFDGVLF